MGDAIAELKRLYEAGTKGEWRCSEAVRYGADIYTGATEISKAQDEEGRYGGIANITDAALIVAMHSHLPALLAALEKCHQAVLVCSHQEPDNCACCGWNHTRGHAKTCEIGSALEALSRLSVTDEGKTK